MSDIDEIERLVIKEIGEKPKTTSEVEGAGFAARQTIHNRIENLIQKGVLKEEREKRLPFRRFLSLTPEGEVLLQKIRLLDYVSASEFFSIRQTLQDLLTLKLGEDVRAHKRILDQIDAYCTKQLTPEELHHILQPIIKKIVKAQDKPFQLVVVYSPSQDQEKIDGETG
jgi:DNA-binding MarR family transcriptional regulator